MKHLIMTAAAAVILSGAVVHAEETAVELRYEPTPFTEATPGLLAKVKLLRPVRVSSFVDKRGVEDTYLGELRVDGQKRKLYSRTALTIYATDIFRKVYGEWGGRTSLEDLLILRGEITQFAIEEAEGYQARVGFHFFLEDNSGRVLWDGHSSGVVRGTGRVLTPENVSATISDILRATYVEMLADDKLVDVWSGRISNSYIIRDDQEKTSVRAGAAP